MSNLRIALLGAPEFELDGEQLKPGIRKNTALLAYLALNRENHTREALISLFWPDHDPSYARAGLRRNLSTLKKSLGGEHLVIERDTVGIDPEGDIELDVNQFRELACVWEQHNHPGGGACTECLEALQKAHKLYRGDFMEGFGLPDTPAFDDWQFFQADSLRREFGLVLERLVSGFQSQGDFNQAIQYASRWLLLDRLNERVHRKLMELYAIANQRAAALRQYKQCERLLRDELGVEPETETTGLYESIKTERSPTPPAAEVEALALPWDTSPDLLDDRYNLGDEIGRGGLGVVYHAHDILLDREVAVKVVEMDKLGIEEGIRLLEEAQAAAKLNHPNIVAVFDAGESNGISYIVMERGLGKSLHEYKPDSLEEICVISRQICSALEYAHGQGIVHRDLKPENVILSESGSVKLTDFGLARPVASRVTSTGQISGTVFYIAPEVALGEKYDGRADLYALGVMLYELTTGRLPFSAEDPLAVITQHIHAPLVPPRARNENIPPALENLILRLLNKNPAERPASAAEVQRILAAPDILNAEIQPQEELSVLKRIERGSLVGRESELAEARNLWGWTLSGQGQTLLISGEPGIGKTRLVREITTQVQVSGGRVFNGACYAEGGVPYAPFTQILRSAFDHYKIEDINLPNTSLAELFTLLPELLSLSPEIPISTQNDDPSVERHRLFESILITFNNISEENPLMLVVEDIHWADSGTLQLLRHLARFTRNQKIMILTTFRDVVPVEAEVFHAMLLDLKRERLAAHQKLARLDRDQTEEMLEILFAEDITSESLDAIYDETEGNPFYIEEVCKALVESGKLYYQDGRWHRTGLDALEIPQSVRTVIQRRVRVLPTESQEILQIAAVIGREFNFSTLMKACSIDEDILSENLRFCINAQLIEQTSWNGDESFSFAHALIPTTLVESMPASKRRELHLAAGMAVEENNPEDYEALALHFQRAGEANKAADYLLKAGDRARSLYASQEAIESYKHAMQILKKRGDLERAARTQMKLGLAYHNAFDYPSARQAYQEGFVFWQQAAKFEPIDLPAPQTLRISTLDPGVLSPGSAMHHPSAIIHDQLFSGLVEVTPDMSILPDAAKSWEVLNNGCKYIFYLRNDVYWSDGKQVTAHDYEFAWKRALDPNRHYGAVKLLHDIKGAHAYSTGEIDDPDILGIHVPDDFTLIVDLEGPTTYFLYLLAFSCFFPIPRHSLEPHGEFWLDKIVTNGPYKLVKSKQSEIMVLERNPKYHGRFSGNIHRVECIMPGYRASSFLEDYEHDELDICTCLSPDEWSHARHRHAEEYISGPWLSLDFIGFDVSRPPFDDSRVRQAFCMAADKEILADVTMQGYVFPATGGMVPPAMPGHSPSISLPYNPDEARHLLKAARYQDNKDFPEITCLVRDDPGHDLIWEYLEAQWLEILGIQIKHEVTLWEQFAGKMNQEKPHMWMTGWWADYPDPDDILRVQWWTSPGWKNQEYILLVENARRASDQNKRIGMYQKADRLLVEEAPLLPLCYGRFKLFVKPWVRRFPTSPLKWWFWKDVIIEPH